MQAQAIITLNLIKDPHTKPHLYVNLAGIDLPDSHMEWHHQKMCSSTRLDDIIKDLPNIFSIIDDILIVAYVNNGRDHDKTLK